MSLSIFLFIFNQRTTTKFLQALKTATKLYKLNQYIIIIFLLLNPLTFTPTKLNIC